MTPAEHTALVTRAAEAIRAAIKVKRVAGTRLTVRETAEAVVASLYGPREAYFRFDGETKALIEFKPKSERAA